MNMMCEWKFHLATKWWSKKVGNNVWILKWREIIMEI